MTALDIPGLLAREQGILLSDQQRLGAEPLPGCTLLLAVPGAGKTTVLCARLAELLANHGANPRRVLVLTYNRESARDMARRWQRLFGELFPRAPGFSTIHSFCLGLLREYAAGRGSVLPTLMEGRGQGEERAALLRDFYREETGKYLSDDLLGRAVNAMGYCVNMQLPPEKAGELPRELSVFPRLFSRYTAYKRENGLMDFDDMLLFADTALRRSATLRERIAGRYDYILADEAQDISRLQHSIIRQLVRDNLFLVGDEDQSIYGFRGAWPQGLLRFGEDYPGGRVQKLEQNYRSTGAIVAGASRVIGGCRQRYPKEIFTRREEGAPIRICREPAQEEEYEAIAGLLEQLPPGESCAVLYRTSFTGIGLGWTLRRRGIPFFSRETGLGYGGDAITRQVGGLMRLALAPGDGRLFRQVYYCLGCGIPRDVAEAAIAARPDDLLRYILDRLGYPGKESGRLGWVRRVLARMAGEHPAKQLRDILEELEYLSFLERRHLGGHQMAVCLQKLCILRDFAARAQDTGAFLERLQTAEQVLRSPEPCPVTLSTVHSAKGQEWDRVIIADALEGIFPAEDALEYGAFGEGGPMEEETRLFYTAMTRARDRLVIFAPAKALGRRLAPSRFVQALDDTAPEVRGVSLTPGLRVAHSFFGIGILERVDSVKGTVAVSFRHHGVKHFSIAALGDQRLFQLM